MHRQKVVRAAARVVAALSAVFWGFVWYGVIDLLVVVIQDERFHDDYLMESGWGLLYLVLVTVPLCVLVVRPGQPVALAQLWLCGAAVLAGAVWGWRLPQLFVAVGLLACALLLTLLGGGRGPRLRAPDVVLLLLTLVAAPVAVVYGEPLARNTVLPEDITIGVSHFPMQASLALAVVAGVGLAAVTRSRLPAYTAALTAVWLGVESVAYPDLTASLGSVGGWLSAAWGLCVVGAVEVARRRAP
jgi:hypothetical protein